MIPSNTKIGVAGCGRMGLPMAVAMHEAGFDVAGFDIRSTSEFGAFQNHMMRDPQELAKTVNILFSVVRDQAQTEAVLFDTQRLASAPNLTHIIICSTLSPRYVKGLRDRISAQIHLLDAPMSGAVIAAEEKRLSFMIGGADDDIAYIQPLFDTMGAHFHMMGGFGAGMTGKVLNNLVAASSTIATRLVMDWADDMGIDAQKLLDLMHTSSGQNWLASNFDDIEFAAHGFDLDNSIGILKKDVESAVDGAPASADLSLPETLIAALGQLKPR